MESLLPYLCMVTVPHIMVGLERMLDYRGVGLARFRTYNEHTYVYVCCMLQGQIKLPSLQIRICATYLHTSYASYVCNCY